MTELTDGTDHTPYNVNLAGYTICLQCSDAAGRAVPWDEVHEDPSPR